MRRKRRLEIGITLLLLAVLGLAAAGFYSWHERRMRLSWQLVEELRAEGRHSFTVGGAPSRVARVQQLLRAGADPNFTTEHGTTLFYALAAHDVPAMEALLEHGADPNVAVSDDGLTPLMFAATFGWTEAVAVLLAKGADPSIRDAAGNTPLRVARQAGYRGTARVLKAAGAVE
jgi:ankyrin repeat protein